MVDEKKDLLERESWIDVLKGIGIILVVIGHVSLNNGLNTWIYTFHMPLFFALSGYLRGKSTRQIGFREFVVKRIKAILWPFVLFRVLLFVYWVAIESHFRILDLGPIWFLIVLFVDEIVAFLLMLGRPKNCAFNIITFVVLAIVWFKLRIFLPENTVCSWGLRCINGLQWYLVGYFVGAVAMNIKRGWLVSRRYLFLLILFMLSIFVSMINPGVSMWSNVYGNSYIIYLLGGGIGALFISLVCKWLIGKNVILEFLGQNTIIILATHEPIKRIILKIIEIASGKMGVNLSADMMQVNILLSIVVVVVVLVIEVMVIRVFRFIKGKMPIYVQKSLFTFVR